VWSWTGALALLAALASSASAQLTVRVSAGATTRTTLVTDVVVSGGDDIAVAASAAPLVALGAWLPTGAGYRIDAELQYSRAALDYSEGSTTADLGHLSRIAATAFLDGPISHGLRWQLGGGRIIEQASPSTGIFNDGSASFWVAALGVTWEHPLAERINLVATARYDYHEFTTPALVSHAFASTQSINRLGLMLGVERTF
jgi:hypothetical protein